MSNVKLTTRQQKLRKLHTQTTIGILGETKHVVLVVGCQSFSIDPHIKKTRRQLEHTKDMLAIALSRVGRVQKGKP